MRPLRLLLSLSTSLIALTLLLYVSFGSRHEPSLSTSAPAKKSRLKALFSFTSPASLFPPSAIISLTDDNSTFFLARPAAFGPLLPSKGLSGPLWIGTGFGDDTMGRGEGELGCSDVPGWSDGGQNLIGKPEISLDPKRKTLGTSEPDDDEVEVRSAQRTKRGQNGGTSQVTDTNVADDGTDDYLHHGLPSSEISKTHNVVGEGKTSGHADIQSLQEGAEIAGKVVLLKRGGCGFLEKVKWAQRRGGVALIVGDDVRGGGLVRMYAHGDTSNITIPALFTSHTTAHLLSSLMPSGGLVTDLSPEDAAKLEKAKGGKGGKSDKSKDKSKKKPRPTSSKSSVSPTGTAKAGKVEKQTSSKPSQQTEMSDEAGWFRSFMYALGFGNPGRIPSKGDSRRPPSSGNIDWVLVEDWDEDQPTPANSKTVSKGSIKHKATSSASPVDFVIGEQDWRDPDLLPQQTAVNLHPGEQIKSKQDNAKNQFSGGSVLPGSGEYSSQDSHSRQDEEEEGKKTESWFRRLLGGETEDDEYLVPVPSKRTEEKLTPRPTKSGLSTALSKDNGDLSGNAHHEGLWVTLTPTNMSSSPFFDTLLVLVVSPLVTLTVVYALLLLRSRIRRRRWRAPKSVVERLPVRTYHTISSDTSSSVSPAATPNTSSPTTPLLHHCQSRATLSPTVSRLDRARPRARTTSEVPAQSSSLRQPQARSISPETEKRESGLAEWRRRYGGRQKECVVCLEEYVDGVSRVMSLPCGHEFHAECITPWLVTRRRTCPICKGDVVRSLSQAHHDRYSSPSHNRHQDETDADVQTQAAETRNESPSAARPIPPNRILSETEVDDLYSDVEANWGDEHDDAGEEQGRDGNRDREFDLSGSWREVRTYIWRGFEALRGATGLRGSPSREDIDRNR